MVSLILTGMKDGWQARYYSEKNSNNNSKHHGKWKVKWWFFFYSVDCGFVFTNILIFNIFKRTAYIICITYIVPHIWIHYMLNSLFRST